MELKKIAVLLPVYIKDSPLFLKHCLDSLTVQTYSDFDIYILVDGSINPDLDEVIRQFPVKRMEFKKNRGLAYVLNDGIELALSKGYDFIARMDADDVCMESRFEKEMKFLEENPEVDCVGTWMQEFDEDGKAFIKKMPASHQECFNLFRKRDCLNHPTVIFRKTYFDKAGMYPVDTYFAEDTMMWAKGFKNGCIFANLQEPLISYRITNDFYSRRKGWKHARSIFLIRLKVIRMLGYSADAYIYAFGYFIIKLLPVRLLKLAYRFLR